MPTPIPLHIRGLPRAAAQGAQAYLHGQSIDTNPYTNTAYRDAWARGYTQTRDAATATADLFENPTDNADQ